MWKPLTLLVCVFACGCDLDIPQDGPSSAPSVQRAKPSGITMAQYNRIQMGMTYRECVAVFGKEGEEMSRTEIAGQTNAIYAWKNTFGSNVTISFGNGKVISKAQFGLN